MDIKFSLIQFLDDRIVVRFKKVTETEGEKLFTLEKSVTITNSDDVERYNSLGSNAIMANINDLKNDIKKLINDN